MDITSKNLFFSGDGQLPGGEGFYGGSASVGAPYYAGSFGSAGITTTSGITGLLSPKISIYGTGTGYLNFTSYNNSTKTFRVTRVASQPASSRSNTNWVIYTGAFTGGRSPGYGSFSHGNYLYHAGNYNDGGFNTVYGYLVAFNLDTGTFVADKNFTSYRPGFVDGCGDRTNEDIVYLLAKTDDNTVGNQLIKMSANLSTTYWSKHVNISRNDYKPQTVDTDVSGNVLVSGQLTGSNGGLFWNKYDTNGSLIWSRSALPTAGGQTSTSPRGGMSGDSSGNTYCGCYFNGFSDYHILKFSSNGTHQWTKSFTKYFYDMVTDNSGNLYIGFTEGFIVKLDTNGNVIWERQLGVNNSYSSSYTCFQMDCRAGDTILVNHYNMILSFDGSEGIPTGTLGDGSRTCRLPQITLVSSTLPLTISNQSYGLTNFSQSISNGWWIDDGTSTPIVTPQIFSY